MSSARPSAPSCPSAPAPSPSATRCTRSSPRPPSSGLLSYRARSEADPADAWALLARPGRWHEWAPHVRGAWGLGDPEVRVGARGAARLLGVVPVPAVVTAKEDGRSWTWRVGPVDMVHVVRPAAGGCEVGLELRAPAPVEALLARTYGPLVRRLLVRLARRAAG